MQRDGGTVSGSSQPDQQQHQQHRDGDATMEDRAAANPPTAAANPAAAASPSVASVSAPASESLMTPPKGLSLALSRVDCMCLPDSLAILVTHFLKRKSFRITAEELVMKVIENLKANDPLLMVLVVVQYVDVITAESDTASSWISKTPSVTLKTAVGFPTALTFTEQVGKDFIAWMELLIDQKARYHFATWPDRVFAFLIGATASLYSTPADVIKFHIFGDAADFSLSDVAPPNVTMGFMQLSKDHYQPYVEDGYVVPPNKPLPLMSLIAQDYVNKVMPVDLKDVECRTALEAKLCIQFRFDGEGTAISTNYWPEFRALLDNEVDTAEHRYEEQCDLVKGH